MNAPRDGVFQGRGLFCGAETSIRVTPRDAGGVQFRREGDALVVHPSAITNDTRWTGLPAGIPIRNTTLASERGTVFATTEHLLSALAGMNRWHALAEWDGVEAPILDGSAQDFARFLAESSGARALPTPLRLTSPVRVEHHGATIEATPIAAGEPAIYTYRMDYGPSHPWLCGEYSWRVGDCDAYLQTIAPARTFSLDHEAKAARAAGLFGHVTPRDVLVLDSATSTPIDNQLRFSDEPCRHKLLDLVGDLALLGVPLAARVVAFRAGHALAHAFCREVLRTHARDAGAGGR